jgi:hypothetical protein
MLKITTRGLEEFQSYISSLARNLRGIVTEAVSDYLIGDGRHGLKHYVPYRYVTRRAAYGKTFVSDKQRRFVMAMISEGRIDPGAPHRTGKLQRAWMKQGGGVGTRIINAADHAPFVMGTGTQARQPAKVGWRQVADIIETNIKGAIWHAESKIREWRK